MENLDELIPRALYQLAENNYDLFETLYSFSKIIATINRPLKRCSFIQNDSLSFKQSGTTSDIDLANPLQLLNYEIATYIIKMRRRALENNQTLAWRNSYYLPHYD